VLQSYEMKLVSFSAPSTHAAENMNVALILTSLPILRESLPESAHHYDGEAKSILRRDKVADVGSVGLHKRNVVQVNHLGELLPCGGE
jgi:hypothetical protein